MGSVSGGLSRCLVARLRGVVSGKEEKMFIVFHVVLGSCEPKTGDTYRGSDREKLSDLLGGAVGFAYPFLPKAWRDNPRVWAVGLDGDCPVALSTRQDWDLPRRDYVEMSFEEYMACVYPDGEPMFVVGRAGDVLPKYAGKETGEIAFLAEKARFLGKITVKEMPSFTEEEVTL